MGHLRGSTRAGTGSISGDVVERSGLPDELFDRLMHRDRIPKATVRALGEAEALVVQAATLFRYERLVGFGDPIESTTAFMLRQNRPGDEGVVAVDGARGFVSGLDLVRACLVGNF